MSTYEGHYVAPADARFAIVASRFNHFVVDRLVEGAQDGLRRHGVDEERIDTVLVPGAWELPLVTARLLKSEKYAAVIALGAVIRGATPHFDYVAGQAASGVASAMMESGVPAIFGVLTTDTIEQAVERAGTKAGNKGWEAALAALEMVDLGVKLEKGGV
ncbi:MAG TPA: 6,7-dimethyl-8-ribityllumazine synthase [Polyangiaceae bacterium LLY-WYZ-15_(1-7)]|nr:6,7-dimethyl-8-ribityllumazine synthase [Myxococcales bacterium]MAT23556.1 6,7-dimethyl-8-ribityllumazine synthase [Sandaracinus sp.]HJK90364.1 6,7-dimethyl-8-ribityllumazine synthase [Polyangiaceae bacterium LLY-WYZ-15_(1-7)]HJL05281.1 6,7-dimethyl-8-ribityllumazine synthase [Polyangiaceae bacterium LLY-WYZ-15_(1-7)]HJL07899.1 6,7-dimethyl-8-ribityllumazine synthase [Polyangiaceae bacterium LLY-WYZ-15_(1-7)]